MRSRRTFIPRDDFAHDFHARFDRIGGIEQRNFILLQIAIIGERQSFHDRQQRMQVAEDAAGLAADQLRHVGIFFLRHHRAAGAITVGQFDEAELLARPQYQLVGKPAQMDKKNRRLPQESPAEKSRSLTASMLFFEIARKTQELGHIDAIDRKSRAGNARRTQR